MRSCQLFTYKLFTRKHRANKSSSLLLESPLTPSSFRPLLFAKMGIFSSCLKGDSVDTSANVGPDAVLKRQQMAEAAEKRLKEQESKGLKDPEKFKRQQQKLDKELAAGPPDNANLRVTLACRRGCSRGHRLTEPVSNVDQIYFIGSLCSGKSNESSACPKRLEPNRACCCCALLADLFNATVHVHKLNKAKKKCVQPEVIRVWFSQA